MQTQLLPFCQPIKAGPGEKKVTGPGDISLIQLELQLDLQCKNLNNDKSIIKTL